MSIDLFRETLEFDVVIVGAGPAGLAAACRLAQWSQRESSELTIAVIEKGAEVGAHSISGALIDPIALEELFPDWETRDVPFDSPVTSESFRWLQNGSSAWRIPRSLVPRSLQNDGAQIASLGRLSRWMAEQAESLGCDVLTGLAAGELIYGADGQVNGVVTVPHGLATDGSLSEAADPGYELKARYVLLAEGCRGHLGQEVERRFGLREGVDPQHYGIGFKEVWSVSGAEHCVGHVEHTVGWPLDGRTEGGGFVYHATGERLTIGFVVALNYRNPYLNPFEEFQRFKQHPQIRGLLASARRIGFGARAVNKGGLNSLPRLSFPGGLLLGCDAGFLNGARMKGIHAAMKSGILAADAIADAITDEVDPKVPLGTFDTAFRESWLYRELKAGRNFSAGMARLGVFGGAALAFAEHNLLRGRIPWRIRHRRSDRECLEPAANHRPIAYPQPDGKVSFDRLSSIHLANIEHDERQPCHLLLADPALPIAQNLPTFDEPAQRYCPAAVYEVVEDESGGRSFRINAGNCIHCKTCEIKDPAGNIRWVPPEGGSGPKYADL